LTLSISVPESTPDATPSAEQLLARATELRASVTESIEETERLTHYPETLHRQFDEAGFYRLLMPKRYGGLEVDLPTYVRIFMELARADASTAWCACLAANHALQIASWFPEQAQDEIFGDGGFRAASVAAPLSGLARRDDDGWVLDGKVSYCSGIPYSTHYMGQTLTPGPSPEGPPGPPLLFVAPRSAFTVLDDWGDLIGLKGSGSNSIVFDQAHVPAHWTLEATHMVDVEVSGGTVGSRLHGNPMYAGRGLGFFTMTVGAVMVGAAQGGLEELERLLRSRTTIRPPFGLRSNDPDYQRWYGAALGKLAICEAGIVRAAELQMEYSRATVEDGRPYTYGDDHFVGIVARESYSDAWDVFQRYVYRYAGSSASRRGERMERIFRDMATGWGHLNTSNADWAFGELARERLGAKRIPLF
jgi:3-hydroxy-9,10-secoandrosta-1,3,5(10)-triene-9,17-dione monooxygenase